MNIYGLDYNLDFTLGYMCHNYIAGFFFICVLRLNFLEFRVIVRGVSWQL